MYFWKLKRGRLLEKGRLSGCERDRERDMCSQSTSRFC